MRDETRDETLTDAQGARLRLGVSACLKGAPVRFDGGHKRDDFVADTLAHHFDLITLCPEMGLGLGAPRPTLRLERRGGPTGPVRLIERTGRDLTDEMERWAAAEAERLRALDLSGFVLKKDSPTCGDSRVRVYSDGDGPPARDGRGPFAAALRAAMPLLPIEEDGRLRDPGLRASFLARVVAYRRLRDLFRPGWRQSALVQFHAESKVLLLASSPSIARALGRLVATAGEMAPAELEARYSERYLAALARVPTRGGHVNALEHLVGHLRGRASDEERRDVRRAIADYADGRLPLAATLVLLRHEARRVGATWALEQRYLEPYPRALEAGLAA